MSTLLSGPHRFCNLWLPHEMPLAPDFTREASRETRLLFSPSNLLLPCVLCVLWCARISLADLVT
jgi:hypothetical protein